ncbi:transcriptional regulator, TetR family [Jatrophihabitans endophyticus]|uniref:Transcriptional regulator, TetR family n=1 Tax=Jatrophihabitans endophyticus TaxID=1206085 RepID=A0A1M5LC45_9ACTN|nr:TetR family transcriptional regulator [Jatrophihabitans endophyticus]SHG62546.1 transcriptional regulator, TetR family [Jatrophihabitans endophyticus]
MNKPRGRGRPAHPTGARDAILAVAQRRFVREGYEAVTLRSVAAEAGVDVAAVSYHFGSKKGLFGAALALSTNPADVIAEVFAGPAATAPQRLVRRVLQAWDDEEDGAKLRRLGQRAVGDPDVARLVREMFEREMTPVIVGHIGGADAQLRAATVISVIGGLIIGRYLVGIEPLASLPADELVARLAPLVRVALAGARAAETPRRRPG